MLQESFEFPAKDFIVFCRALMRPFEVIFLRSAPCLLGEVAFHQQSVDVLVRVLPAILMHRIGMPPQGHGSDAEVLRHDDVPCMAEVDERKIYGICAGSDGFDRTVIRNKDMVRITEQRHGDLIFSGYPFNLPDYRAGIGIDKDLHVNYSFRPAFSRLPNRIIPVRHRGSG